MSTVINSRLSCEPLCPRAEQAVPVSQELTYLLGRRNGRPYFLVLRATPGFEDPRSFAVVVYYNDSVSEEQTEIARIDTAHGFTHFEKLYRRDRPKEPVEFGPWEAVMHLGANWRRYADRYDDAHAE